MFNIEGHRIIKQDTINDVLVSTIFTGTDMNYYDKGLPILWETMIFPNARFNMEEEYCERYSDGNDALEGHKRAVEYVKEKYGDDS